MKFTLLLLGIGGQEIIFIALIVLLLFGGKKIPEMMRGLGRGIKSFKEGMNSSGEIMRNITSDNISAEKTDSKNAEKKE